MDLTFINDQALFSLKRHFGVERILVFERNFGAERNFDVERNVKGMSELWGLR